MASGSHYGGFFGGGYKIGFDWSSSRAGNENASNITVIPYLYIKSGYTISSSAQKSGTITINGTNHNFNFTIGNVKGETWLKLASGFTTKVGHNSDGSKTCNLKVSATLNLNLSGSQIGTVSADKNVALDKYNLNSAPTLGGSVSTTPASGYFSEKATSIPVSWPAASDANNNLSNYYLEVSKNGGGWTALATLGSGTRSYNHSIPAAEGTSYQYRVRAKDSQNAYSGYISSNKITSNTLTGGSFTGTIPSINYGTTSFTMNFSGGKNSDGSSVKYLCYSDNITVYNQTETTGTSQVITIYKSGSTPSGPYIRFDDLKNYLRNSNYNGRVHIGLRTGNGRGTYKYNSASLSVDLRTNPGAPSSVVIQENTESTAYLTNAGTGNKYFIPDGNKTIKVKWDGGSNPLGGGFTYTVQQILNGKVSTVVSGLSSSTKEYTIKPAKLSGNSTATLAFRVQVVADYGNTAQKDSTQITLHSYNGVSFSLGKITRTATDATVNITIKTTSSVPNINTVGTWSCNGKSGNLTVSQAQQSFKITGLTEQGTYTATITYKDNTGWSSNQTASVSIGALAPIVAITKEGLGVGGVEANANAVLNVKGNSNFSGDIQMNGKPVRLTTANEANARIGIESSTNDVFIANYNNSWFRIKPDATLTIGGKKVYTEKQKPTAAEVGALALTGGTLTGDLTCNTYLKLNAWSGYGSGTANFWFDGNNKTIEIANASQLKLSGNKVFHEGNSKAPTQGNWFSGGFPRVGTDGVMEVGKYIDFHASNTSTSDYNTRIYSEGGNLVCSGAFFPSGQHNARMGYHSTDKCMFISNANNNWFRLNDDGSMTWKGNAVIHHNYGGSFTLPSGSITVGDDTRTEGRGFISRRYEADTKQAAKLMLIGTGSGYAAVVHRNESVGYELSLMTRATAGSSSGVTGGEVVPSVTNIANLGTSTYKWKAVYATNGTIQTSDERFKIKRGSANTDDCFEMVKNTELYKYIMLDKNKEDVSRNKLGKLAMECNSDEAKIHMGVMAQDIQKYECGKHILVEGEYEKEDGTKDTMLHVNPYDMTMAVMGALKHEISLREKENDELKQENNKLKQEIDEIKQELAQIKQLLIK